MGKKTINKYEYPFVIAEVSQNHDGSLGQAHAFIDAVAETGADAIKFQTHIASKESTFDEPFRVRFSYEDSTRYDYWKRMEFTREQWKGLLDHSHEKGLEFLSSPFSIEALELLDGIGVPMWKFGSGEVFNRPLIDAAIRTGKPIIISTGLSTLNEIKSLADYIKDKGSQVYILYCVTAYPSKAENINIKDMILIRNETGCPVGISDHSATVFPALCALSLGASMVEVHVTMSRYMFGPDVKASVTIEQLKQIVEGKSFISKMLNSKNTVLCRSSEQEKLKEIFSKSVYYSRNLNRGYRLRMEDLIAKKPNVGIDSSRLYEFVGRKLVRDVKVDTVLKEEDLEL